jgi:hypothetical protein
MPSLGIHLIVVDEVLARLRSGSDPESLALASILENHPELTSLGAIGPDLIYYYGLDRDIVATVASIFNAMNQISSILGDAANVAADAGAPNFSARVKQLADTTQLIFGTGQGILISSVVRLNDLISGELIFKQSEEQEEKPETEWSWGDLIHDRMSGVFASEIANRARQANNEALMAYATAYKTHLATDFVGHPFVNSIAGGPARGWNMRHTLAEKFMDATVYAGRGLDINSSRIQRRMESLHGSPDLANLAVMLSSAMTDFVSSGTAGPFQLPAAPSVDDILTAFDNMDSLFRLVTEDTYVPPPIGPSIIIPPLPGQYGSITSALGGGLIPPGGIPKTLTQCLKMLLFALLVGPSILAEIARFIADIVLGVITYPMAAALYLLQSWLYRIYRQIRWFLVISGMAFPYKDELRSSVGRQFGSCRTENEDSYPHLPPVVNKWRERWSAAGQLVEFDATDLEYLVYPSTPEAENPQTRPSPYPHGSSPELFINQLQLDDNFLAQWEATVTPLQVRDLVRGIKIGTSSPPLGGFGNAVDLALMFINRDDLYEKINLDSDRGYGYRQWACDGGIMAGNLINERFL